MKNNSGEYLFRTLLVLSSLGFCVLAAELTVRLSGLAPEVVYIEKWRMRLSTNPEIAYEPIPNFDSREKSVQFYGYQGVSNDLGFRDKTRKVRKAEGSKRIIVLGDSVAEGLWIPTNDQTYPAVLESLLREEGLAIEVLNFAVSGYNTKQEVATLADKGLKYEPDLVILTYCLNDKWDDSAGIVFHLREEEKMRREKSMLNVASLSSPARYSALVRLLQFRLYPAPSLDLSPEQQELNARDTRAESLKKLAQLSKEHGFEVLIVFFPDFDFLEGRTKTYDFFADHLQLKNFAKELDFKFFDLFSPFKRCKEESSGEMLSYDRFHPRPHGNRCAAMAIKEFILESGLIKRGASH